MKKTLLVLSAILALSLAFVGCKKSTGDNNGDSDPVGNDTPVTPAFVMTYNAGAQWAAPAFTVADDWTSIEVVFAADTAFGDIQFAFTSDKVKSVESWGNQYFAYYPAATETSTFVIADALTADTDDGKLADNGATKITSISIQNKTTKALTVKVISAKVTKAEGTVIDVKPVGDWASSVN